MDGGGTVLYCTVNGARSAARGYFRGIDKAQTCRLSGCRRDRTSGLNAPARSDVDGYTFLSLRPTTTLDLPSLQNPATRFSIVSYSL